METLRAHLDLAAGDRDYLAAMLADPSARAPLVASAREEYRRALIAEQLIILHYYIGDEMAKTLLPAGYDRSNIDKLNPDLYPGIIEDIKRRMNVPGQYVESSDDIKESLDYIGRETTRLAMLGH
jgi:hypothetical protein